MSIVIDANMKLFADRMHISSSRMIRDYGLSTVDEIIEAEAEKGNSHAVDYAREYYHSPEKLIKVFRLADVENKYRLITKLGYNARLRLLPMLEQEDLVMGLNFFTQDKLLEMLLAVDIEELVNVAKEAFPIEQIILMYTEEDLAAFFGNKDLDKNIVVEQMELLPPDMMQRFIEGVTGRPSEETNSKELINSISKLPDDKFHKFMAGIDPDVQRQLTYQIFKEEPDYMQLFSNETYTNMLSTMMKPDMIKPMIMLDKETLVKFVSILPDELMSIVASQVDTYKFAKFLQHGSNMKVIEQALMI